MYANATAVSAFTAVAIVALAAPPFAHAQGALKPVDAMIVNPVNRPVPVTVLSSPTASDEGGRQAYSMSVPINFDNQFRYCESVALPAGKRLVLEHLSGLMTSMGAAALQFMSVERSAPLLVVPAAPQLLAGWGAAGQPVRAYLDTGFSVCATATGINNGRGFLALSGHLVNLP